MSSLTYNKQFKDRLLSLIQALGGLKKSAEIAGVTDEQVGKWRDGKAKPSFFGIAALCNKAGAPIDWLVGLDVSEETNFASMNSIQIPRYDVHLAAGGGYLNADSGTVLDQVPFTHDFLQKQLNRSSIKDLAILQVSGDSMQPTIDDGGLVMVDQSDKTKVDGIFAFVQDELARVKRLRFLSGGKVEIVSDNRDIYSPEILSNADAQELIIIGRVCWIGHTV